MSFTFGGGFGSSNPSSNPFGGQQPQPQQQQPGSSTGGFGFGGGGQSGGGGGFGGGTTGATSTGFGFGGQGASGATPGFGSTGTSGGAPSSTGGFGFGGPSAGGFGGTTGGGGGTTGGFGGTTGGFGASTGGTSSFGSTQPAGGFGSTASGGFGGGGNTFGSSTGTTGPGFGSTSTGGGGFGATGGGFGSTGTTGFGTSGTSTTTGGGGGFGSTTPAFGSGTGSGGFGSTTGSGGFGATGGGFGSTGTTSASTTGGGFGTGSGGFGSTGTTGGFGAGTTPALGFGSTASTAPGAGSAAGQWDYEDVKEQTKNNQGKLLNLVYHSISMMDRFKDYSPEQLRWEFIKAGSPAQGQQQTTTSSFGGTTFGTQQQQPASTSGFGTTGGSFGFGQQQPQQQQQQQQQTGGFSFGGAQPSTASSTGGGFGFGTSQPSTTSTSTAGGGGLGSAGGSFSFGNTQQQQQPGGISTTTGMQPASTGGGFSFGGGTSSTQQPTSNSGFSLGGVPQSTTGTQPSTSGFSFGSTGQQQQSTTAPSTSGFSFGGTQSTAAPTTTTTGTSGFSFGGTQPQQSTTAPATSGFSFGNQPSSTTATSAPTTGFSFGSTGQQQQQQPTTAPSTSGFSFSQPTSATAPQTGFSFAPTTSTSTGTASLQAPSGTSQMQPIAGTVSAQHPYGSNINIWLKELEDTSETYERKATPPKRSMIKSAFLLSPRPPARIRPRTHPHRGASALKDRLMLFNDERTYLEEEDDEFVGPQYDLMKIRPKYPEEEDDGDDDDRSKLSPKKSQIEDSQRVHFTDKTRRASDHTDRERSKSTYTNTFDIGGQESLPKLTKTGFYTVPSMQDLKGMSESGRSTVHNFTVGRKGFGQVKFLGETDVRGLDLDKLVVVGNKNVEVYPEDVIAIEDKPPVGKELNKRAEITLWNIRPKRASNIKKFRQRLEQKVIEFDAQMVDYRAEEGEWIFIVQHFSKYGLDDDDEDDEDVDENEEAKEEQRQASKSAQQQQQQQWRPPQQQKLSPQQSYKFAPPEEEDEYFSEGTDIDLMDSEDEYDDEYDTEMDHEGFDDEQERYMSAPPPTGSKRAFLPKQLGMDARKFHEIHEHLFAEEEEEKPEPRTSKLLAPPRGLKRPRGVQARPLSRQESSYVRAPSIATGTRVPQAYQPIRFVAPSESTPSVGEGDAVNQSIFEEHVSQRKVVLLKESPMGQPILGKSQDTAMSMGRSFRVSFGPDGSIAMPTFSTHPSKKSTSAPDISDRYSSPSMVSVKNISILGGRNANGNFLAEQYVRPLKTNISSQFSNLIATETDASVPTFELKQDDASVAGIIDQYVLDAEQQLSSPDLSRPMKITQQQHVLSWKLIRALFSNTSQTVYRDDGYAAEMYRKRQLSQWLREALNDAVESNLNRQAHDYLKQIYTLLTGNRIAHAAKLAIENSDYMLSAIIAQAGSEPQMSKYVHRQLDAWQNTGANNHISRQRIQILELICGSEHADEKQQQQHQPPLQKTLLDWKRLFGTYLWYRSQPHQTISETVSKFEDEHCDTRAHPAHVEEFQLFDGEQHYPVEAEERQSILYHLIKLFTRRHHHSLSETLHPLTTSHDPLDYRLSWHLYQVLGALHFSSEELNHEIHTNFAFQLQQAGLWKWAVYVLTHLEVPKETHGEMDTDYEDEYGHMRITSRKHPRQVVEGLRAIKENAIKDVIRRHISIDEDEDDVATVRFLVEHVHIPDQWIQEAKAIRASVSGDHVKHFQYRVAAKQFQEAHRIIVTHVAPNMILGERFTELKDLLLTLARERDFVHPPREKSILEWHRAGKVYLTYIDTREKLLQRQPDTSRVLSSTIDGLLKALDEWDMKTKRFAPHDKQLQLLEHVAIAEMTSQCHMLRKRCDAAAPSRAFLSPASVHLHPQQANQHLLANCLTMLDL